LNQEHMHIVLERNGEYEIVNYFCVLIHSFFSLK